MALVLRLAMHPPGARRSINGLPTRDTSLSTKPPAAASHVTEEPIIDEDIATTHVWYTSYGSNMSEARFRHYLQGGRPDGATRDYPGARDRTVPSKVEPVMLAGSVFFAWESPTWGGGIAFYDPAGPGTSYGRAYLVTAGQFADVAAQEMHRIPDADLDLTGLLADGHTLLGPGRYERLLVVGEIDGLPVVTFTASWTQDEIELNPPVARYLQLMAAGLRDGHHLDDDEIVAYLLARPGARPRWTTESLAAALEAEIDKAGS